MNMSNTASFTIAYDGPALANHEMDARDLGAALLALCALMENSSKEIYGKDCRTTVTIKAGFKPGSFEIDFGIAQSYVQQLMTFMNSDEVNGAMNLVEVVGFGYMMSKTSTAGLFQVLKFLKGKKPDKVMVMNDQTIKFILGQSELIAFKGTDTLYKSIDVRREFNRALAPLERDGIDSFEIRKIGQVFDKATKDDMLYFYDPSLTDEANSETLIGSSVTRKTFSIASLDFKPGNKWRLSDGSGQFHVEILDKDFLDSVSINRTSFCKDDLLVTDLKISEYQTPKGLRTDYQVIKVIEHKHASRQLELTYAD